MYPYLYRIMRLLKPGGLEIHRHLHELEDMQWLTRPEIESWQLTRAGKHRYIISEVKPKFS